MTIEEKVAAATLFAQAAASVAGTETETSLFDGADKILNSAMEQVSTAANKARNTAFNDVATHAQLS